MQKPNDSNKFVDFIAHELAIKPFISLKKTSQTEEQSHKMFPDGHLRKDLNKMRFKIEK